MTSSIISLTEISCGKCGIIFCVPAIWQQEKQMNGSDFYCPNGHVRVYRKSDIQELKERLEAKEAELRAAKCETLRQQNLRQMEEAAKLKAERKLKRANKGVCTCCNRTFQNLMAHMKTQHPEVAK